MIHSSEECVASDEKKESVVVNKEKREDNAFSSNLALRLGLLQGRSSSVHQAFHLMQTNPKVQVSILTSKPFKNIRTIFHYIMEQLHDGETL